jgi:hypothetical protein
MVIRELVDIWAHMRHSTWKTTTSGSDTYLFLSVSNWYCGTRPDHTRYDLPRTDILVGIAILRMLLQFCVDYSTFVTSLVAVCSWTSRLTEWMNLFRGCICICDRFASPTYAGPSRYESSAHIECNLVMRDFMLLCPHCIGSAEMDKCLWITFFSHNWLGMDDAWRLWQTCIIRDGHQSCPGPYVPLRTNCSQLTRLCETAFSDFIPESCKLMAFEVWHIFHMYWRYFKPIHVISAMLCWSFRLRNHIRRRLFGPALSYRVAHSLPPTSSMTTFRACFALAVYAQTFLCCMWPTHKHIIDSLRRENACHWFTLNANRIGHLIRTDNLQAFVSICVFAFWRLFSREIA